MEKGAKRILIINPFGIGDVLFTTPIVRAVKQNFPDAFIGYWANLRTAAILKNNPYINRIFALSRGDIKKISQKSGWKGMVSFFKLLGEIKKGRFNISLDFSLDHRYSLISKLLGIRRRIGFNYKRRGRFLTEKRGIDGYSYKHVVEYYADLLHFLNIKAQDKHLDLFVSDTDKKSAEFILENSGIRKSETVIGIACGAGASWGKEASYKHWPPEKFAQLCDKITDELKARVIILGDESEKPIAEKILNIVKGKPVDLAGKTSLEELAAIMKNLKVLITNDGGPLHIGVAAGIKTVSLFGPVDELVYGPYPPGNNHIVIKEDFFCRPCYQKFKMPACGQNKRCISAISVERVFDALRRLL